MRKNLSIVFAIGIFLVYQTDISNAHTINWVIDWEIQQADSLATGSTMQNSLVIDVSYTGHISHISAANYWSEGSPPPYTGNDIVDNAPTSGITLSSVRTADSGYANIIAFSSPVKDPLFALYSVGAAGRGVPYEFDQEFTLLSEGWGGWGDGEFVIDGNTITGFEGNGVIQFHGMISTISWNNPVAENHHGFAVGVIDSVLSTINQETSESPAEYFLSQNYPNPFNPATKIAFTLPMPGHTTITVYNALGQQVATLLDARMNAGIHDVQFDASAMPSGIYFYRFQVGDAPGRKGVFSQVRKMVLFK